jgi:CheY-like chemotaxis protein
MMPQTEPISRSSTRAAKAYQPAPRLRTVAVVSRNPDQHVLGSAICAVDHDVVLVEPTDHAYSHIKEIRPDLVIVCMSGDDIDGCRVLSMLALDRETSAIPVLTHVTSSAGGFTEPSDSNGHDIGSMSAAHARVVLN